MAQEHPTRRKNPSGKYTWQARVTTPDGSRTVIGSFKKKGPCDEVERTDCCAQHAMDAYYATPTAPRLVVTLGSYADTWTEEHPRSERTNRTNEHRLGVVRPIVIDGRALEDWPLGELRRKHTSALIKHLLVDQGRSIGGVRDLLRTLSAMMGDAIEDYEDEFPLSNPFKGMRLLDSDQRITKRTPEKRVWTIEQMHTFAEAAGPYEPMVRVLSDCGVRLGELLALKRSYLDLKAAELRVFGTAWNGKVIYSSREKNHDRLVPLAPSTLALLRTVIARIDSEWLFCTPGSRRTGKVGRDLPGGLMWRTENWRRQVWKPAQERSGMNPTPQEFRVSWVSAMRAAGVDYADLAELGGHSEEVATERYTKALRRSGDAIRRVIG